MNNLYFLRHNKTRNNIQHIITGEKDVPIVDKSICGLDRMDLQGEMMILCSPLLRCKQTVEALCENLNFIPQIEVSSDLLERNFGVLEGKYREKAIVEYSKYFHGREFIYDMTPPNGESYVAICNRADRVIDNVKEKLKSNSVILCSHNHLLKIIYFRLLQVPIEDNWYKTKFLNGKIYKIL